MHTGEENFKCKECANAAFKNYEHLRIHVLKVHKGIRFICDTCGKEFTTPGVLNKHVRKIHGKYVKVQKQQKR